MRSDRPRFARRLPRRARGLGADKANAHGGIGGAPDDYEYDVFVSYQGASFTLLERLLQELRAELEMQALMRIFIEQQEVRAGQAWTSHLADALRRSRLLLPLMTPAYFRSPWSVAEYQTFVERERRFSVPLIVPVLVRGHLADLPDDVMDRQILNLTRYTTASNRDEHAESVRVLAERIVHLARGAPPYSPDFPVVSPQQVEHLLASSEPPQPRL
jgi:hypothetical protein